MASREEVGIYSPRTGGHRESYLEFAKKIVGGIRVGLFRSCAMSAPVIFLFADEKFERYFFVSLIRGLLGKRTVGLLFRPIPVVQSDTLIQRVKYRLLQTLKNKKEIKTLSIIPVHVAPVIEEIVDGWVLDFQFWDLSRIEKKLFFDLKNNLTNSHNAAAVLYRKITKMANGRLILVSLGAQSNKKGYGTLTSALPMLTEKKYFVVIAGMLANDIRSSADCFTNAGMLVENRFLSNDEITAVYAAASIVWCHYDPTYDQSSGILGRAMQLGVLPLVRRGSIAEKLCISEGMPYTSIEEIESKAPEFPSTKTKLDAERSRLIYERNSRKLKTTILGK